MASYHERFFADKEKGIKGVNQFVFTGDGELDIERAIKLQTLFKPGSEL